MSEQHKVIGKLALIVYFFVMGTILIAAPWSSLWPHAIHFAPWLSSLLGNPTVRGAISGFGLVLIAGAILEIRNGVAGKF